MTRTKAKQNRLRQLSIKRIDLVDRGAAVDAKVTLFKRRDSSVEKDFGGGGKQPMTLQQLLAAMPEEQRKLVEDALRAAAQTAQQQPQAQQNQPMPPQGKEPAPQNPPPQFQQPKQGEKPMPEMSPEQQKYQDEMKKALEAERQAVEKKFNDERAEIEKQRAADREELAKAKAEVAKIQEENLERECVSKASEFPRGTVGLSKSEAVSILKALRQEKPLAKEIAEKLEKHFRAVDELLAKSALFKEFGSSLDGNSDDPQAKLEAVKKQLMEKDATLSEQAAIAKAYELHPKLYSQVRAR